MPNYKIFPEKLTKKSSAELDLVPLNYVKYLIGFACARNEGFNLVTVQMRFQPDEPWRIVASNVPSSGGQATIELGYYSPGIKISTFWIVRAVTKIASMSVYIINDQSREIRRIAPAVPPKKMEHGEDWGEEVIDFVLF